MVKTMARQAVPCSPWRSTVKQISGLQTMEDLIWEHMAVPWKKLQPMESPYQSRLLEGAGLLAGPVTPRGTHAGAACA